ncbi:molybdate ABC transporter substrate-binding protein [Curtobacterium aurantiacum]|uniref:molybdate ABC transporter substrate-binding protein n=1 Tax=Curtobacterium aurantiacum TaxID=3236919 RepID=UPI001BE01A0A|nr:molybdate ABC transporter substrate-binding protein [Curtobacterium flaccumfaciens]MBT1674791.1 molybdate ABC transporter substrate-binding protein [Curtobacterium flaccumfaciens pv. flaccumfaciens]
MSRHRRPVAALALVATVALGLAACTAAATGPGSSSPSGSGTEGPTGSITVFAAASLQQTFTTLGKQYETAHPGASIRFSFAGSSDLVTQIQNGAPADVFAAADQANMAKLTSDDLVSGSPRAFATNTLEIAVAPGNPEGISGLDDLTAPGVQLVTCAAPVPCGAAAATVERAAGIDLRPVSEEQSVTDVLGKVQSGQADAGLVYVTDVRGADGAVDGVPFDESAEAVNTYPIGVLRESADPELAHAFTDYVRSATGQRVLSAAGFGKP